MQSTYIGSESEVLIYGQHAMLQHGCHIRFPVSGSAYQIVLCSGPEFRHKFKILSCVASELGLNPKLAKRAGLLHDIGKVSEDDPELPHALLGAKLAEQYKERPEICNAIGSHHDEMEMTSIISPLVLVGDAISGARPGARREVIESYIKRLKDMENLASAYAGVTKAYAIQAGRELRVIVGAEEVTDEQAATLSTEIAQKIQEEMTYPGQVKITVIRETRSVAFAK